MRIPLYTPILCAMFGRMCISPAVASFRKIYGPSRWNRRASFRSLFIVSSCRIILVWSSRFVVVSRCLSVRR
jgi:hypothetical protein